MAARGGVRSSQRQTPRVVQGKVQKKHNHSFTPDYYYEAIETNLVVVDRQRPGDGYRHVLTTNDVYRFLNLLPDWETLGVGLNGIVLAPGEAGCDGWHERGVVAVCAWPSGLWRDHAPWYFGDHADIFARLGVVTRGMADGRVRCEWSEPAVRAYQLLHILLHELGHHHDRMTTRRKRGTGRGEIFAEEYARQHEAGLWEAYTRAFPEW